ncbi:MAG: glycosyltransferase family 4 protein [Caulobacteraceae bacterium]
MVARSFSRKHRVYGGVDFAPRQIQVAAFYARRNGISQGAELQRQALAALDIASDPVDAAPALRNPFARSRTPATDQAVIAHASGRQVALALNYLSPSVRKAARIGYCAWELGVPPRSWVGFDAPLHEVWTPSTFSAQALRGICRAPVRVVRHVCRPPPAVQPGTIRRLLNLEDSAFVALVLADARSSFARKNPLGAVNAFSRAFAGARDVALVVKISAGGREPGLVEALKRAASGLRVVFIEQHLDEADKWRLFRDADVFLSLHRAEGFGIPMLEAMSIGKPVIATEWSGNLDFMDAQTAVLVPYTLVDVEDGQGVYSGGQWAEPDIDFAADALRKLKGEPDFARRLGAAAQAQTAFPLQLDEFASQLPPWALELRQSRTPAPPPSDLAFLDRSWDARPTGPFRRRAAGRRANPRG